MGDTPFQVLILIAFITEYTDVDRIIDHLKLAFVAYKLPSSHVFDQISLTAAEEQGIFLSFRNHGKRELTLSPFFVGLHKNSSNKVSRQEGFYVSDFVGKALAMSGQGHKQHGNMRDRTVIPGGGQADDRPGSGPFSPDWRLGRFDHSSDLARLRRRRSEKNTL